MIDKGAGYSFTLSELKVFLFGKKICPNCGCNLLKEKDFIMRTDLHLRKSNACDVISRFGVNSKVKQYVYNYVCKQCNFKISLSELADKKKKCGVQ